MRLFLNADDLARCETASRILLSPLAAPSVDDWRREAMGAFRAVLGAERATFALPGTATYFLGDGIDEKHGQLINDLASSVYAGVGSSRDPFVDACNRLFLARGAAAWDLPAVEHALAGLSRHSIYYNEVLVPMRKTSSCRRRPEVQR